MTRWFRAGAVGVAVVCALAASLGAAQEWRRLAIASFNHAWQVINDTYYDPTFGGLDWAAVRAELGPRIERAETPEESRCILRDMVGRLKQSHFALLTTAPESDSLPGDATAPIDVRLTAAGLIVTRAAATAVRAGVHPGDRILGIDGHTVASWIDGQAPTGADDRTRRFEIWKRAYRALHGADGSVVHLDVERPAGRTASADLPRARETGDVVTLGNLPPFRVRTTVTALTTPRGRRAGVIAFNVWLPAVSEPIALAVDRFRAADGLLIDLRGNPGGLADMIRGVAGHVLDEPAVLGRMHMRSADLEFRANPRRSTTAGRRVRPFAGPVAVLVDELTASASECFAGGLQSLGRARVFGAQTMGQALPAATEQLPDGDVLLHAIGDFVTSTGRRLEGVGVIPDEVVTLDADRLATGRDPVVDAALAWVDRAHAH